MNGFKQLASCESLIDDISKGKKVPIKDAISILGIDASYVYDSLQVLEITEWTGSDAIEFVSGMNLSKFTKKLYKHCMTIDPVRFVHIGELGRIVENVIVENPDQDPNIEHDNNDDDDKNKDDDDDKNNNDNGQTQPSENRKKPLSKGNYALIAVGAILGVVVISVCILVVVIRIKHKNAKAENTTSMALII